MADIIYIEDNPDDAFFMHELVSGIPEIKNLEVATSLAEGKEKLLRTKFDLVFLDLSLPDSFGIETIKTVYSSFSDIPIIVFTGLNNEEMGLQAISSGAQDYLIKGEYNEKLLRKSVFYAIERHKGQQEIKRAQENLSKAEEIALLGNWEFTLDGSFSKVSTGVHKIFGLTEEATINSLDDYFFFVISDDVLMVKNSLAKLTKKGDTIKYSERIRKVNGEIRYLDTTVECSWNEEFEVLSIFGVTIDVTESKLAQIRLKESEVKLLEAQVLANIGNWEYDFANDRFHGSPHSYKIFDLDPNTTHSPAGIINEMTWGSDAVKIYNTIKEHVYSKEPFSLEFKVGTPKGATKYIKAKAQIFPKIGSEDAVMRGTVQDVTALKEAELVKEEFTKQLESQVAKRTAELVQTKKKLEVSLEKEKELGDLKSRFVSTASHQFRTPLTVIQSSVGLLDMQLDLVEEEMKPVLRKVTSRIKNEVVRMTSLMNDVLILGKIEARSLKPVFEKVQVVDLVQEIVKSFNEIQDDARKASIQISGEPASMPLDPNLFEHSFSNILSNAFKYSKGKKAPIVNLLFEPDLFQVKIKDFGIGIPKTEVNSLFEPFFRASNVGEVDGTGLGTAIVKEYVELMNGEIDFTSEEQSGSEFILTFNK
ncbi:MAG: ATP-binding protein [Crocinitomicaceae bacterium]